MHAASVRGVQLAVTSRDGGGGRAGARRVRGAAPSKPTHLAAEEGRAGGAAAGWRAGGWVVGVAVGAEATECARGLRTDTFESEKGRGRGGTAVIGRPPAGSKSATSPAQAKPGLQAKLGLQTAPCSLW